MVNLAQISLINTVLIINLVEPVGYFDVQKSKRSGRNSSIKIHYRADGASAHHEFDC